MPVIQTGVSRLGYQDWGIKDLKRAVFFPIAVAALVFSAIVGAVIFKVMADQTPHSVLLKWNPSTATKPGATVASYEVFRRQGDGSFERVASGLVAPTYVDNGLRGGKTYSYFVRAIDSQGRVGPPSDQISMTIH